MQEFLDSFGMKNLVKETMCYKNLQNPTCIDLILKNSQNMFQNTKTVETGLSDFHKMTVTVLKTAFKKSLPKIITYRDHKKFVQLILEINCTVPYILWIFSKYPTIPSLRYLYKF